MQRALLIRVSPAMRDHRNHVGISSGAVISSLVQKKKKKKEKRKRRHVKAVASRRERSLRRVTREIALQA